MRVLTGLALAVIGAATTLLGLRLDHSTFLPLPVAAAARATAVPAPGRVVYLEAVRRSVPALAATTADVVLATGDSVCARYAHGDNAVSVGLTTAEQSGLDAYGGALLAGIAVWSLCPQYAPLLPGGGQ